MAQIVLSLSADTSALREVLAEISPAEQQAILGMIESGDDSWLHIGDPRQVDDAGALVFTVGLNRDSVAEAMKRA